MKYEILNIINMTRAILFLMMFFSANSIAYSQYFNNVNNELCYELYRTDDALSEYRVFMVIDKETIVPGDTAMLDQWTTFSHSQRSKITQRWATEGRRIEAERAPYITNPPKFETLSKAVEMKRVTQNINWESSSWKDAKKYWLYPDRPF